jgi:hypothetical protein
MFIFATPSVFIYFHPDFRDSPTDASVKTQNENSPDLNCTPKVGHPTE